MILADISTGEVWMIVLTGLMAVAALAGTFWKPTNVQVQQPLDVQVVESLVTKEDCGSKMGRQDASLRELWQTVRSENQRIDNSVAALREALGALKASNEIQNHQLASLDRKLDGIPERVIATLRNTGAIGGNHD